MWHRRPRRWTAAEGGCATREVVIQYGTQRSEIWEWYFSRAVGHGDGLASQSVPGGRPRSSAIDA